MSEAMFNKNSWNRAMGPALRTIGYFATGLLILFLAYYILYFIAAISGSEGLIITLFGFIGPLALAFYFILCIFKVLDEELSGFK